MTVSVRRPDRPRETFPVSVRRRNSASPSRAIVTDPTPLLADEPTGDLDAKSASEVLTLLQRLNQEYKKTIVMVTHDPHAAERASRVLHLEKGSLIEQVPS
jgi:putative ABC transport system ATP-binding protein